MNEKIDLTKQVFKKSNFDKIIDRNFKSLAPTQTNKEFTITDFFELYDSLFTQIPKEGEIESHRYIYNRTIEYLGIPSAEDVDIQALLNEITSLRQELLESNKTLAQLNK